MSTRPRPITIPPKSPAPSPTQRSAIIFIHGLGDEGSTFSTIASQFQAAGKLPYTTWIFPTAPVVHDLMQNAWYMPSPLSPFPSQRPELDDPEDEEGLLESVRYIEGLIDGLVARGSVDGDDGDDGGGRGSDETTGGIPPLRIILAGFSQGSALSLLLSLISTKYAGKLAGIGSFCGYLPLSPLISEIRQRHYLPSTLTTSTRDDENISQYFLVRGAGDMMVPKRYFRIQQERLRELGVSDQRVTAREYQGMAHALGGACLREFCGWVEGALGDGI